MDELRGCRIVGLAVLVLPRLPAARQRDQRGVAAVAAALRRDPQPCAEAGEGGGDAAIKLDDFRPALVLWAALREYSGNLTLAHRRLAIGC
jgi:hypothetical protein